MFEYNYDENRTFFQRHRELVFGGVILVLGVGIFFAARALGRSNQQPVDRSGMIVVSLPPPPPPPPPTPQPTPPQPLQTPPPQEDHRMEEQPPVQDEKKPEAPKEKAPDAPAPLGTTITGLGGGPDLGLVGGLGGEGGYGSGAGGAGGSKYGWYASEVQNRIADVVRNDARMRRATMHVVVRIWPDSAGRIIKAVVSSSGNRDLETTIQNQILTGLQLTDPPPSDMPLPIVMRMSVEPSR